MKKKRKIINDTLKGTKTFLIFVIFMETITYVSSFLLSGLAKKDIFNILEDRDVTLGIYSLWWLIVINVTVPLMINCVKQINSALASKVRMYLNRNIKLILINSIMSRGLDEKVEISNGEVISIFRNESMDVVNYLMMYYNQIPRLVLCVAILIIMPYINPVFAAISIIPTLLIVFLISYLKSNILRNRKESRERTSKITEYIGNIFEHVEYFKMTSDRDYLIHIYKEKCKSRRISEIRERTFENFIGVLSENASKFVLGIILLFAIPLYRRGLFSIGELIMFEYYYAFLSSMPDAISKIIRSHKQTSVSINRISCLDNQKKKDIGKAIYNNNTLYIAFELENKPMEIHAERGKVILIRDQKENDKSILLRRLFEICKRDIRELGFKYITEQPIFFDKTVKENICLDENYDEEKFLRTLQQTGMEKDLTQFGDGQDKRVGKQGQLISGGQRKRLGIARAIYSHTDVLFIDGLSESLDERTEMWLIENFLEKFEGILIIASNSVKVEDKIQQVIECTR